MRDKFDMRKLTISGFSSRPKKIKGESQKENLCVTNSNNKAVVCLIRVRFVTRKSFNNNNQHKVAVRRTVSNEMSETMA